MWSEKHFVQKGREGVYYPIIIYDESGNSDNKVCAIHVNESERDLFEKYSADSIKSLDEESGVTPYPVLEYSGRILEIHVYIGLYDTTVRDSEMAGQGFEIKKYVVDATVDKKEMKKSLIDIGVMMIGCLIGAVVVTVVWKKRTGEGE
jgi:hypothetical protein